MLNLSGVANEKNLTSKRDVNISTVCFDSAGSWGKVGTKHTFVITSAFARNRGRLFNYTSFYVYDYIYRSASAAPSYHQTEQVRRREQTVIMTCGLKKQILYKPKIFQLFIIIFVLFFTQKEISIFQSSFAVFLVILVNRTGSIIHFKDISEYSGSYYIKMRHCA